jgi:hypothetical protein
MQICNEVIYKRYHLPEINYIPLMLPLDINLQVYHLSEKEHMSIILVKGQTDFAKVRNMLLYLTLFNVK